MKRSRRIAAVVASIIAFVLVLLAVLPLLFKDQIAQRAQVEINKNVNARVSWRSVGLSFFRHFPNLSLTLDDLRIAGVGPFAKDTLAAIPHLRVVLDLGSVLRNVSGSAPLVIRAVELDQPRVSLITLENGAANWDIAKKLETAPAQPQASKPFSMSLKKLAINNARVSVDNRQSKLQASLVGYTQSLAGDFSQDRVTLESRGDADTVNVTFAGIPYLKRVKLGLTANVKADFTAKSYTLESTELSLNDLKLIATGSARSVGKTTALDLAFKAPSTNFRSVLSLVPAVYARDFDKIQTAGTIAVDGKVKGQYGEGAFPSFAINTKVDNAAFKYSDLPLPARSIYVDLSLTNPGGSPDSTVVRLDRFRVVLGQNPIEAKMSVRTPVSDPDVDARVAGTLDLTDLRKTVKLEGIEELTGKIAANAAVKTRMSAVQKKQYDRVAATGSLDVGNLVVKGNALPHPMTIQQASLALAPQRAQLKSFAGTVGSSDIQASGTIENLLAFVLRDDTLHGTASVQSKRFNLNEWKSDSELEVIPVPPRIDFALDANVAELQYDSLKMTDAHGRLHIKDQKVTLEQFDMNTLGGQIGVTGFYETTHIEKPTFDLALKMTKVDIPGAFKSFSTVQKLAPIAKYATGNVTTDLRVSGGLDKRMMPVLPALTGAGTFETSELMLHDFPAMNKIVEVTKLQFLKDPTLQALKASFKIQNGRLAVQPFTVKLGEAAMRIAGSNGLDQSMLYNVDLSVPRKMMGASANQAFASLASKAGKAGVKLDSASVVPFAIQLAGTVLNPAVKADVGSVAQSAASSVAQSVTQAATQAGTQRASAEATRLVQEAEQKAATIRQEAQTAADKVKLEGYRQADSLVAKAGNNPLLKVGAKAAADKLRKETDDKAAKIVREADQRANGVVAAAKEQASKVTSP